MMMKLRRSRFMKFIAGVLIIVLAAAVVGNIVGTIIIMDENLYYASRQQIQQKVYSYLYDYTASDLMRYLNVAEDMYCNDENYKNYQNSEMELYRSKYNSGNSNIYFEIKDEYGNLLLNNDNKIQDGFFTFSSVFVTSNYDIEKWYVQGGSQKENVISQPQVSDMQTTYPGNGNNGSELIVETTVETLESTTFEETHTSIISETEKNDLPLTDTTEYSVEEYSVINTNSGNTTKLYYNYNGSIDFKILDYCKETLKTLPYDITEFTFTQDDFSVYYYGEAYDNYEIVPAYEITDDSAPLKKFSTKLLTDEKEINVNYSYNGSISFSEFESRLKYLSLIARYINEENLEFSYTQKGGVQLQVRVDVPHSCYSNDIYNAAEELVDIAIVYRDNIVAITVADALLLILSLVFLFWSAGYIPKKENPVARGLHAIPFDVFLFILILASAGCIAMINTYDDLFIVIGITGLVFIVLCLIYTIPVRIRTKTLKRNNLFYKLYRAVRNAAEVMDETAGSRLKIFIVLAVFLMISACEILFFLITSISSYGVGIILMFIRLAETPFIAFLLTSLLALHNGAKQISKGDVDYRINHSFLLGPLKKHAEYLNSINDAVNNAVDERMRSESLKTELITNVSHDLKTPLTSIVNYVDLLKKTEINDTKALEYIEVIDRQSQKLKKLTIDIVEASKAATGNIEVTYENTALNVILLQTNGEYIERLEEKALTLVQEIPDKEIIISTDGRLLWRVIDNLMNNICKYSMPGTRVYLSLWEHSDRAFISFRNISKTKLNISPDALTERFVRGDTSRNTEGSGLGLSIANSLTEIMGGKLSIIIDGDLFKVTLSFPTVSEEEPE